MCECGIKLEFMKSNKEGKEIAICKVCKKMYIKENNSVRRTEKNEETIYANSLA
jgi:hypothetical protein